MGSRASLTSMRWCRTRWRSSGVGLLDPMSKWRYTCTLSAPMISPRRASAKASASSDFPEAVGPTTTATSASPRSSSSTADLTLQLIPADSGHDGATMRTVPREIHLGERGQKSARLFRGHSIASSDRTMTSHRGENEVDRIGEGATARPCRFGDEIADDALRARPREQTRHGVHGDGRRPDGTDVEAELGHGSLLVLHEGGVAGRHFDGNGKEQRLRGDIATGIGFAQAIERHPLGGSVLVQDIQAIGCFAEKVRMSWTNTLPPSG